MSMQSKVISQLDLKRRFRYDPETGRFTRRVWCGGHRPGTVAGSYDTNGYRRIVIDGKDYKEHRLAWLYVFGVWPEGQIDHINGKKDDNRIENLRDVDQLENAKNQKRARDNTSGVTGVNFQKKDRIWIARICVEGKRHTLGVRKSFEEACSLRREAEKRYGFHENHGSKR